jgi:hypothetical protein
LGNVSELGLVTPGGKVVWGKYAQVGLGYVVVWRFNAVWVHIARSVVLFSALRLVTLGGKVVFGMQGQVGTSGVIVCMVIGWQGHGVVSCVVVVLC